MNTEPLVADETKTPHPFDLRTIKYLVQLMGRHELSEIDLREGELRIRLRRGALGTISAETNRAPIHAPAPVAAAQPAQPAEAAPKSNLLTIKSPTPGTFYTASSPDAEAFVRVGSRVTPDTVVCIIEAMKVFNEITADCTGTIAAILVENQQPVEFGQVLFQVDPS